MLLRGLAGLFSGRGFAENDGRHPSLAHADWQRGPLDIALSDKTGRLVAVGKDLTVGSDETLIDGRSKVAMPAWIDSHTHAVFAGSRTAEFFQRWTGRSYRDIAKEGGGIAATQRATAECPDDTLVELLSSRLRRMHASGCAVVEVKSGYGRSANEELRLLRIIARAAHRVPEVRVVPTFLGLHSIPEGRQESDYVEEMIALLTLVKEQRLAQFVDSFPEIGFFSLREALHFSEAATKAGFRLKAHADELSDGGAALAFIGKGAVSIDHLQHAAKDAIEALRTSRTVATLLPATSFYLGIPYADARGLIAAGAKVSLASDYNPGTAPCHSLSFTALLAAANLHMTPAEIFCGLTYNASCALGVEDSYGTLAPGKMGALLLLDVASNVVLSPETVLEQLFLHNSAAPGSVVSRNPHSELSHFHKHR